MSAPAVGAARLIVAPVTDTIPMGCAIWSPIYNISQIVLLFLYRLRP